MGGVEDTKLSTNKQHSLMGRRKNVFGFLSFISYYYYYTHTQVELEEQLPGIAAEEDFSKIIYKEYHAPTTFLAHNSPFPHVH